MNRISYLDSPDTSDEILIFREVEYMSPDGQPVGLKAAAASNLYTVILALAFAVVLATMVFVAYKCYFQYEIIFRMP